MALGKVLVYYDCNGNLQLHADGLNVVKAIPGDFGIEVIAAVGPGRIGKSSLLNQLSGKDSFGVGSTTTRVTKGIWVDFKLDNTKKNAIVYIDVEGFGDPDKDDASASDFRLMFIVCQMCDAVIYNTKGVYDSDLVKKLELVCHMFKRYRKHHEVFSTPMLIVCLRDFDLDIPENPEAELRDLLGHENYECFRSIKVFCFERPTEQSKLRDLQTMRDLELNEQYKENRQKLKIHLDKETKPLCTYSGSQITATVFVEAIRKIFNAVTEDNLEGISKSLIGLLHEQNDVLVKEAENEYTKQMQNEWPTSSNAVKIHNRIQCALHAELKERLYDIEGNMNSLMSKFKISTKKIFETISEKKAKDKLKELNSTIESKYNTYESYFVIGGFDQFQTDMDSLEQTYLQCVNLGPNAETVWKDYKKILLEKGQTIKTKENILSREREIADKLEQSRLENQRLTDQMRQETERQEEMNRRQEEMRRQRRQETMELAGNIVVGTVKIAAGVTYLGLRMTFCFLAHEINNVLNQR